MAEVLMDMARTETSPRTDRLAEALVAAIKAAEIRMHRHPHQTGGFSVLKSPDIPSVLLELGFLSSDARSAARLIDPDWRAQDGRGDPARRWRPGRTRMRPRAAWRADPDACAKPAAAPNRDWPRF